MQPNIAPTVTAAFARVPLLVLAVSLAADGGEPRAAFQHSAPEEAKVGTPLPIEGSLTGSVSFSKIIARVRGPGEPFEDYILQLQYGDLYRVQLPASRMVPPGIEYYIEGITKSGSRMSLFASARRPVRVLIEGGDSAGPGLIETMPGADEDDEGDEEDEAPVKGKKGKKGKKNKKKKGKKGKGDIDEEPPAFEEPPPDKTPEVVKEEPPPKEEPKKEEPKQEEPPKEEPKKHASLDVELGKKSSEPVAAKEKEKEAPGPVEVPRSRSELEEELAVYGAEEAGGFVQRLEEESRHQTLMPTVVTAEQLKQLGVRYVPEALDLLPGLTVSRDVQGSYRLAVRGLRSAPEVLILLNGQRLNNPYDGAALAHLPVDDLERIEVYRGPAGVDVGLGNVLAVVNLVTRRSDGVRVVANGGLYEAFDGHLVAAKKVNDQLQLFADADVASQFGYRADVPKDGLDTPTSVRAKHSSDRLFLVNVGGGASYASDRVGTLGVDLRFIREDKSALLGLFDVVGNDSKLSWQVMQGAVSWEKALEGVGVLSARAWLDLQSADRLWQLSGDGYQVRSNDPATRFPDGILEHDVVGTMAVGLAAGVQMKLPQKNEVKAGLSLELSSLTAFQHEVNYEAGTNVYTGEVLQRPTGLRLPTEADVDGGGRGPAADRFTLGLYAADTWTPSDALAITAGFRFDLTQLPQGDATGAWVGKPLVPSFGPRLGVAFAPVSSLVLRANYGRSFRAPTPQELAESIAFSDFNQGRFVGNPQLTGAYLDAIELGGEYLQSVGDSRLRLRAAGFFERMGNAISRVDPSGNLPPYTNRPAGVQSLGLEGEARFELTRRAQAWVNASWVRAEDLGTPAQSRLLTDVPQVRFNAGFSLPIGPYLNFDVISRYASERRNDSRSVLELIRRYTLPATTTVAAQLRTEPLFDHVEIAVLGQNVFDTQWADDAWRPDRVTGGVPREGAMVFGTVRVGF